VPVIFTVPVTIVKLCQYVKNSVADLGCLFRIPNPDFYPSRISDPGSKTASKESSHKLHKIENYFIFEMLKKICGPIFKEL
jgi:hypothetical protein